MNVKTHPTTRRAFISTSAGAAGLLLAGCASKPPASDSPDATKVAGDADVTICIGTVLVDIAKGHTISTTGYNGSVPGPLIRLKEGVPVTVDLFNEMARLQRISESTRLIA